MNVVLDSNILFTFFWKQSVFSSITQRQDLLFFCPELGLEELKKYAQEIQKKASLTPKEFKKRLEELHLYVQFVPEKEYCLQFKHIAKTIHSLPGDLQIAILDDIDFLALAFQEKTVLWSNEQRLKKQAIVEVLNTKEIINLLY